MSFYPSDMTLAETIAALETFSVYRLEPVMHLVKREPHGLDRGITAEQAAMAALIQIDRLLAQQWIACSERLPELEVEVIWFHSGQLVLGHRYWEQGWAPNKIAFSNGRCILEGDSIDESLWMPLPAPPIAAAKKEPSND